MTETFVKTDVPLWFTDLTTLRTQRKDFDNSCEVTTDNFSTLIAATHMREDLRCQLWSAAGGRCNQPHHHGWVAKLKDGREGLIGGICADRHFKANERFRAERSRMYKEMAIENNLVALGDLLKDRAAVQTAIADALQRLDRVRQDQYRLQLPTEVLTRIQDMIKSARSQVEVEVLHIERDEKGKETRSWRRREVGAIRGLLLWDVSLNGDVFPALGAAESAARRAVLSRDEELSRLKSWREALEQIPRCQEIISSLDRALLEFSDPQNLAMLCHLVGNQNKQREIAALILKRAGVDRPSELKVQDLLNKIHQAVRGANGGRNFRTVH